MPIKDRDARNAYMRDYYARNPEVQRARVTKRNAAIRDANREIIIAAKSVPCADCGVQYPPCVMDFDHVTGEKRFNVGNVVWSRTTTAALLAEIAKCEVVCSNCHRIRTFLDAGEGFEPPSSRL